MSCNLESTLAEVNPKLVKNEDEELVDPTLFKEIVGSLRYTCNRRPYIVYVFDIISRFMSVPIISHMLEAKRVMRYIKGTLFYCILFPTNVNEENMNLFSYSDKQDRKSTLGYLFMFMNYPISWCTKKQFMVAFSTCESEYIAGCLAACQAILLDSVLKELKIEVCKPIAFLINNKFAID